MSKNLFRVFVALVVCATTIHAQSEQTSNFQPKTTPTSTTRIANDAPTSRQTNDDELPRFEVGAQFTSLTTSESQAGFGGRLTFNLNRSVALEAQGDFFPRETFRGRTTQFVAGVKIGKRFDKFGVFGKARPGVFYESRGTGDYFLFQNQGGVNSFPFGIRTRSQTSFALDAGGVLEFYPTKKLVTRFDFGDTIIVTPPRTINVPFLENNVYVLRPLRLSTRTTHNFQFSAGVGFRF